MNRQAKKPLNYFVGSLLGGAVGDALGAPVEFLSIEEIRAKYGEKGIQNYVEFENACGEFTDDTQMTLFTAEGLLRAYFRAGYRGVWGGVYTISHHSLLRWLHTRENTLYKHLKGDEGDQIVSNWLIKQNELYKRRAPGNTCLMALKSGTFSMSVNQ